MSTIPTTKIFAVAISVAYPPFLLVDNDIDDCDDVVVAVALSFCPTILFADTNAVVILHFLPTHPPCCQYCCWCYCISCPPALLAVDGTAAVDFFLSCCLTR